MARTLSDIMASLNPQYDPERAVVNSQLATLPGQRDAEIGGLDAAKSNAFGEITNAANRRGVLYSGAPIDEQNRYVGEKYLPARAAVAESFGAKQSAFQSRLAEIGRVQGARATDIQQNEQEAEARQAMEERKLQLEREKMAQQLRIAQTRASSKAAPDPAKGFSLKKDAGGGLAFTGPNGRPVTAAQYANVTGTNIRDLLASSGNKGDAQILKAIDSGASWDELAAQYPYVFGGV